MAISLGVILSKPGFIAVMILLGVSKLCYSIQSVELAILHYDYDYFELGSCIYAGSSTFGAVFGICFSAFLDPFTAVMVLVIIACAELVVICFMRERF